MGEFTGYNLPPSVHHLLWVAGAALFLGIGGALLTLRAPTPRGQARLAARRAVALPLLTNLALVCLLADLFLTSAQGLRPELALYGGILFLVFGFGVRFPRAVGLPVLGLLLAAGLLTVWMFKDFRPYAADRAVLDVRILQKGPASVLKEFDVRPESASGDYPAGKTNRETPGADLLPEGVLVFQTPSDSLFAGVELFTLKKPGSLDFVQQPFWQAVQSAGWGRVIKPTPEAPLEAYYIYRLRSVRTQGKPNFVWQVFKPEVDLP